MNLRDNPVRKGKHGSAWTRCFLLMTMCVAHLGIADEPTLKPFTATDLLALFSNQVEAVKTLDVMYDLNVSGLPPEYRFQRRQFISDYATGKFLARVVYFEDAARTEPSRYHVEQWDGAKQTEWEVPISATNMLKNGMPDLDRLPRPSFAGVYPRIKGTEIFRLFRLDLTESQPLCEFFAQLVAWRKKGGDAYPTITRVGSSGFESPGYKVLLENSDFLPTTIEMSGGVGDKWLVLRRFEFSEYAQIGGNRFPRKVVLTMGNPELGPPVIYTASVIDGRVIINEPVEKTIDAFNVPLGTLIDDNVANKRYINEKPQP